MELVQQVISMYKNANISIFMSLYKYKAQMVKGPLYETCYMEINQR